MELRQLKYFVKTAELLNFSEAARALFITQSTLSQQIKQLEQEFGTELFQRDSHSVTLTESGSQLLPYARQTLLDAELCFEKLNDLKQMLSGSLKIGITYTFAPILTEAVRTFAKLYPSIKLSIVCKTMEELMEMLLHREVDFVLSFKPLSLRDEIESHTLFDNHLAAILSGNHPLADKDSLSLDEIRPYPVAMPAMGMQARNAFDACFRNEYSKLNVQVELNEVNTLLDLVKSSTQMLTFLSEATIDQKQGLKAIRLEGPDCTMEGCVHVLRKSYRKKASEEFIRILCESQAVRSRANSWLN